MTHKMIMLEKRYLICMRLIRWLRKKEIMTEAEYAQARRLLQERFRPKIAMMFDDIPIKPKSRT